MGGSRTPAANSSWQELGAGQRATGGQQAALDRRRTHLVLVDAVAVVGDLEDDGPAGRARGHRDRRSRASCRRGALLGGLAAVVDRVDDEVLEGVGDPVEHLLVELDVLAHQVEPDVLAGRARDVADQLAGAPQRPGVPGPSPGPSRRRAPARAGHANPRRVRALMPGRLHLVGDRHHAVDGRFDFTGQGAAAGRHCVAQCTQPVLLVGRQGDDAFRVLLHPARIEFSLTDDIEQVVDTLRRDPHGVNCPLNSAVHQSDRRAHRGRRSRRRHGERQWRIERRRRREGRRRRHDDGALSTSRDGGGCGWWFGGGL